MPKQEKIIFLEETDLKIMAMSTKRQIKTRNYKSCTVGTLTHKKSLGSKALQKILIIFALDWE